ncbi:Hint domain-containing protein [Pseudooctadecabacter jejudonensis]|uniref:Hedgehog/Intein (Hint) domain-containing protein n=1 Tax=Pseudooctadecabacter jejudonensis TaxID=1391910 RepID=A0A1Y5TDG8_9RHOB|nr:Hint domain-containing protein [Pseudooctadecabacter jejudonensis]SLN59430.1 hypothetical protein PSJ8397_03158 [Pseudooctadecabacter jejudonensis]
MHLGQNKDFTDAEAVQAPVTSIVTANASGLTTGTTVMTMAGETPVEDLEIGDRVITRDAGMAVLRDIRSKKVKVTPICIKAGSLGHTRPQHDMVLGPDTLVHIRDWRAKALFGADVATVKAKRLLDGEFVSQQDEATMTVYDLIFDRQHIIYADGLEIASTNI